MALAAGLSSKWPLVSEPMPHMLHVELARLVRLFPILEVSCAAEILGSLGIDIISACDVAEGSQFSIKEVDIGLAADVGTLAYLPKIKGNHSLTREMAYSAAMFSVVDAEREIVGVSPIAVSGTKRILLHSRDHSVGENLEYIAAWNAPSLQTQDIPETLAMKARRAPKFAPLRSAKL
ncbi:hypothetical protein B0H12DRAFT_1236806 [Mycena haematopus]|nr:hypothetical protein B0H12DRAFT_1236806 [Mycena haematopus]